MMFLLLACWLTPVPSTLDACRAACEPYGVDRVTGYPNPACVCRADTVLIEEDSP